MMETGTGAVGKGEQPLSFSTTSGSDFQNFQLLMTCRIGADSYD